MKNQLRIYLFLILNSTFFISYGQDIHFSQFYMSPLTQNPAMAGANYDMQALVNYKDQWQSVATPYKTMAGSFDMRFNKKNPKKGFLAAGINLYNDRAGDSKMGTMQANLNIAYHVRLNDYNTLGAGLQGGFVTHHCQQVNARVLPPSSIPKWAQEWYGRTTILQEPGT